MFKILKNIGATSPTPLSSRAIRDSRSREGSRRVGDVGAESRGIKNYASSGESTLTDEDYREMMRDPDIEAVDIVTEVDRHAEIGLAALACDKHVLCEILVTASLEESDRLMEKAAASQCPGWNFWGLRNYERQGFFPHHNLLQGTCQQHQSH